MKPEQPLPKSEGEDQHAHLEKLRNEEVPRLVHENQSAEHQYEREKISREIGHLPLGSGLDFCVWRLRKSKIQDLTLRPSRFWICFCSISVGQFLQQWTARERGVRS